MSVRVDMWVFRDVGANEHHLRRIERVFGAESELEDVLLTLVQCLRRPRDLNVPSKNL